MPDFMELMVKGIKGNMSLVTGSVSDPAQQMQEGPALTSPQLACAGAGGGSTTTNTDYFPGADTFNAHSNEFDRKFGYSPDYRAIIPAMQRVLRMTDDGCRVQDLAYETSGTTGGECGEEGVR